MARGIIVRTAVRTQLDNYMVVFEFEVERKPRFVIVNMILPSGIVMSLLNIHGLFDPHRVWRAHLLLSDGASVHCGLPDAIASDNLPKNSSPMSLFSYYLLSLLVISVTITLAVICSLHVYHRSDKQQPGAVWRAIARCLSCYCVPSGQRQTVHTRRIGATMTRCEREENASYSGSRDMNSNACTRCTLVVEKSWTGPYI